MKIISPQNSFSNILEEANKRIDDMPESKTKKLKETLEHGLAELKTEDILRMDLNPKSEVVVHLLSNVIDMPEFPRETVARKLNDMNDHYNIAVCVSPFYQENGRAKHMDEFGAMLHTFNCHYEFEKHTDEWDKPYSCQVRVFVSKYY